MDAELEAEALALMQEYGIAPMTTEQPESQAELPPPTYAEAVAQKAAQFDEAQTEEAMQEAARLENEKQVM